ncbi:DUF397 domain-containing protein [Spirillospora sp. NPDC127200]
MMELITPVWRKSSHSGDEGTHCIEVAAVPGITAVRDSKDPDGPKLFLDRSDFRRLTSAIKRF